MSLAQVSRPQMNIVIFLLLVIGLGLLLFLVFNSNSYNPESSKDFNSSFSSEATELGDKGRYINGSTLTNYLPGTSLSQSTSNVQQPQISTYSGEQISNLPSDEESMLGEELMEAYGYFSDEEKEVYKAYSNEVLQELAKGGDLLALEILVQQAMDNYVENPQEAIDLAYEAVIHGSTNAAMTLGYAVRDDRIIYPDKPEYKEALIESMAWFEFGVLRGDPTLINIINFTLKEDRFKGLSEGELQQARELAKEFHDSVNQERVKRGLGEFENEDAVFALEKFSDFLSGEYLRKSVVID